MMGEEKNIKIIRITSTTDYYVKMIYKDKTSINGWTIEQVKQDWFENTPLDAYHATRDQHRIGNSKKLLKVEVIDFE
jgi:hypothetical protein